MHAPLNKTMHPQATMHAPPVDRIVDTCFWKYYLAPTSLRAVNISCCHRPQRKLRKVMFQRRLSVILSRGRGGYRWREYPPRPSGMAHIRLASGRYTSYWNAFLLPSATKLQQGNVFTPACQSFCSQGPGGCLADTPRADTHMAKPPGADTSLLPPTATAADGTHPTGMLFCWYFLLKVVMMTVVAPETG